MGRYRWVVASAGRRSLCRCAGLNLGPGSKARLGLRKIDWQTRGLCAPLLSSRSWRPGGSRARTNQRPVRPLNTMPRMKYFWPMKNTTITGTDMRNAPAMSMFHAVEYMPTRLFSPTDSVMLSRSLR